MQRCWRTVRRSKGARFSSQIERSNLSSTFETKLLSGRSEEHTSELQSPCNLVCRLLLEKKKIQIAILARWHYTYALASRRRSCALSVVGADKGVHRACSAEYRRRSDLR